jgi:hypothetical protein
MHFASRMGLDQSSVRGIPAAREERIKRLSSLVTPGRDPRDAEIAALKARVAELETALRQSQSQSQSRAVSRSQKNKPAADISAKPKDEPWKALGLSKATYYRRKAAGAL